MGNFYSTHRRPGAHAPPGCATGGPPEAVLRVGGGGGGPASAPPAQLAPVLAARLAEADDAVSVAHLSVARALPAHVVSAFLRAAVHHSPAQSAPGPAALAAASSPRTASETQVPHEPPPAVRVKDPSAERCWPQARTKRRADSRELSADSADGLSSGTPSPRSISLHGPRVAGPSRVSLGDPGQALSLRRLSLAGCEAATDDGLALILRVTRLTELNLERCVSLTDGAMLSVASQTALRELSLDSCKQVGSAGIECLAALRLLRVLSLARCSQVTDEGLMCGLQAWTRLQVLSVAFCFKLTCKSLAAVNMCPNLTYLDVRSTRANAGLWASVGSLARLRALLASHTDVTDEGVEKISGLHELRHLDVESTRAGDGMLRTVSNLKQIEMLNLGYTLITEVGVTKYVTKLAPTLKWLNLEDAELGDFAAERLGVLTSLETLNLADTNVTSFGIAGLCGMASLRSINLCFTGVTETGLRSLRKLANLQVLALDGENVGDEGLRYLSTLSKLEELELYGASVTDRGLTYLAELENLRVLELCLARVTDDGAKHLSRLRNMQVLNLSQNRLGTQGVCRLLAEMRELQTLNIAYNRDVDEGIVDDVCAHPRLSTICIQGIPEVSPAKIRQAGIVVPCNDGVHPSAG